MLAYMLAHIHHLDLFTTRSVGVEIETVGEHALGRTIVDWYGGATGSTIQVVKTVNAEGFYALLTTALKQFS
jgi:inosine-uridine nucleoside N-ribohydrolase